MVAFTTAAALTIGAVCTGAAAVITAWAGLVRARGDERRRGAADCEQRLATAREEAERAADLLHRERMGRELEGPDQ